MMLDPAVPFVVHRIRYAWFWLSTSSVPAVIVVVDRFCTVADIVVMFTLATAESSRKRMALEPAELLQRQENERAVIVAPCGRLIGAKRKPPPDDVWNRPIGEQKIMHILVVVVESMGTAETLLTEANPTLPPVL